MLAPRFKYGTPSPLLVPSTISGLYVPALDDPCCCCECTVLQQDPDACIECIDAPLGVPRLINGFNVTVSGNGSVLPMAISQASYSVSCAAPATPTIAGTYVFTSPYGFSDCLSGYFYPIAGYTIDSTGCPGTMGAGFAADYWYRWNISAYIAGTTIYISFGASILGYSPPLGIYGAPVQSPDLWTYTVTSPGVYNTWKYVLGGICRESCNPLESFARCWTDGSQVDTGAGYHGPTYPSQNAWLMTGVTINVTFF